MDSNCTTLHECGAYLCAWKVEISVCNHLRCMWLTCMSSYVCTLLKLVSKKQSANVWLYEVAAMTHHICHTTHPCTVCDSRAIASKRAALALTVNTNSDPLLGDSVMRMYVPTRGCVGVAKLPWIRTAVAAPRVSFAGKAVAARLSAPVALACTNLLGAAIGSMFSLPLEVCLCTCKGGVSHSMAWLMPKGTGKLMR